MRTRPGLRLLGILLIAGLGFAGVAGAQTRAPAQEPATQPAPRTPPIETLETLRRFPPVGARTAPLPAPRSTPYDSERSTTPGVAPTPPRRSFAPKLAPVPYDPRGERQPAAVEEPEPEPAVARPRTQPAPVVTQKAPAPRQAAPAPPVEPTPARAAPAPPVATITEAPPAAAPIPQEPAAKPAAFPFAAVGFGGLALLLILAAAAAIVRRMMMAGGAAARFSTRVAVNPGPTLEPEFAPHFSGPAFAFCVRTGPFTSLADYPDVVPAGAAA